MSWQLIPSSEHENLMNELRIDMQKNSEPELDPKECCIYRVPKMLRNVNKEAYTPQMVSIGPLHHGNKGLANMEKVKRSYMKNFLEKRITHEKLNAIFNFVKDNENKIRNCYSEISNLKSHNYIKMILFDAIFIIELFMRNYENTKKAYEESLRRNLEDPSMGDLEELLTRNPNEPSMRDREEIFMRIFEEQFMRYLKETSDSFISIIAVKGILISDLELLENQLPYFVLEEIYKLASCSNTSFMCISRLFIGALSNTNLIELTPEIPIKHFTDWRRYTVLKKYPRSGQTNEHIEDVPCAMKLYDSGVRFKKIEGEDKPLKFDKHERELQLPQLEIVDGAESILRNVMALEQCHYPGDTHIGNFIYLMDHLIETEKDVDLLVGSGIISNKIGDNSSIANMFNKLGRHVTLTKSPYYNTCKELKEHYDNPWNKTMGTLRRVYFSNLWRGTGTIAAVILLLLTVIQTICSILQTV